MSNNSKDHAFPNAFRILHSIVFKWIDKYFNLYGNLLSSGILPLNSFVERFNTFKVAKIEKSSNVSLILFACKINSCNEFLEHLVKFQTIIGNSSLKLLSNISKDLKEHVFP